jgi:hypothetical protein
MMMFTLGLTIGLDREIICEELDIGFEVKEGMSSPQYSRHQILF